MRFKSVFDQVALCYTLFLGALKKNPMTLMIYVLVTQAFLAVVLLWKLEMLVGSDFRFQLALIFFMSFLNAYFQAGFQFYLLKSIRGENPQTSDLFCAFRVPGRFILLNLVATSFSIIYVLVLFLFSFIFYFFYIKNFGAVYYLILFKIGIGLFALTSLLGLFYIVFGLIQVNLVFIDRKLSVIGSIRESWTMMKGQRGALLLVALPVMALCPLFMLTRFATLVITPLIWGVLVGFYYLKSTPRRES
ncbi:MAG: hypothetical protein ACO3A2_09580 [Bdellovibrionia bacterium]